MPITKQILRLQSDQTLDDPQMATRVRLKGLAATRTLNILWAEPAVADRDLTFRDPGANDWVVYENLAQTLASKTLTAPVIADFTSAGHDHSNAAGGGTVDHASIGSPAVGDDHTQYPLSAGRAGGQTVIGGTAAGEDLSLQSTSNASRGDIIAIDNIAMGSGKEVTGLPAVPGGATSAASKAYVDTSIAGTVSWRETLLSSDQLDDTNDAISNASALFLANTAQIGDTIILNDGGTTETWTFAGASVAFAPAIGASALASMTDLVTRINTDSTAWSAALHTGTLQEINSGTGNVVVIYRQTPTAATTDRVYGVFTTPADGQIVDYGSLSNYLSSTNLQLPAADPATANFGFGRITAALQSNDAHSVRAEDTVHTWNGDAGVWKAATGAAALATSGSGGATIGQATFDSDFGLEITGGTVARAKVDGVTMSFTAGDLSTAGRLVENVTSDNTITAAESGKVFTNLGDAGLQTQTLPAGAANLVYTFGIVAAFEMRIDPQAGDHIVYSGGAMADGEYISSSSVGSTMTLIGLSDGNWLAIEESGSWAEETP